MPLTGIEIFKLLPKTNCGECGVPTCLAFAMSLAAGKAELSKCPYVSEETKATLSEASAPPIATVTIGVGDRADVPHASTAGIGALRDGVGHVGDAGGQEIRDVDVGRRVGSVVLEDDGVDDCCTFVGCAVIDRLGDGEVGSLHGDVRRRAVVCWCVVGLVGGSNGRRVADRRRSDHT